MCVLGWLCVFLVQFLGGLLAVKEPAGCVHACSKWQTSGSPCRQGEPRGRAARFPPLREGNLKEGGQFINSERAIGINAWQVKVALSPPADRNIAVVGEWSPCEQWNNF